MTRLFLVNWFRFLMIFATAITLIPLVTSCLTRKNNAQLKSPEQVAPLFLPKESLDLLTQEGKKVSELFASKRFVGAVYIGQVGFVKAKNVRSSNASFFEEETLAQILENLPVTKESKDPKGHFRLIGCKKRAARSFVESFQRLASGDLNQLKDAFMPNYARIFETEVLSDVIEKDCVETLKTTEKSLNFEFYIKPEITSATLQPDEQMQRPLRQVMIVSSSNWERKAVFESLHPVPQGDLLVVLRNNSYGKSAPQAVILPSDRPFTSDHSSGSNEVKTALFALGWTPGWLRNIRDSEQIAAIASKPANLVELSARFHAVRHYIKMGDAGVRTGMAFLVPVGILQTSAAYGAIQSAVSVAMLTKNFHDASSLIGIAAPVIPLVGGISSAVKAFCDLAEIQRRAELADPQDRGFQALVKSCHVMNIILGISSVAQTAFTTPALKDLLNNAIRISFETAAANANLAILRTTDPQLIEQYRIQVSAFLQGVDSVYTSLQLGITNLPLARALHLNFFNGLLEHTRTIDENAPSLLDITVQAGGFFGLDYGMGSVKRMGFGCPNLIYLQPIRLGQNWFTDQNINWKGCFQFLREAYLPSEGHQKSEQENKKGNYRAVSESEEFWQIQASLEYFGKLNSELFGNAQEELSASTAFPADAEPPADLLQNQLKEIGEFPKQRSGAMLKAQSMSQNGPVILRSSSLPPWNTKETADAALKKMVIDLQSDIEICSSFLKQEPKLCKDKLNDCTYKCAASALHKFRNEFWPAQFVTCLESKTKPKFGCIVQFDDGLDVGDKEDKGGMKATLSADKI